jgi:glycosyltransferase involved in cell wall biosynthesis
MRIELVVHHEFDMDSGAPGGVHRVCLEYRTAGHEAEIYSFSDLPRFLSPRQKQLLFPLFVAWHLGRAVRRRRIDVVDASTGDSWLWSLVDPARRRVLLVTMCHGLEHAAVAARRESARRGELHLSWKYPLYYGGLHLREVTATLRRADLVFLLNRRDREYAVRKLGVEPRRIRIVTNGIRDALVDVALEPTPFAPDAPIRIAQVGSYLRQKGVHYGADAVTAVLRRHPNVSAGFFGTGLPPELVYADYPADVHDQMSVVQRYPNVELVRLLRDFQIIVFPTLSEGFGTALLEAMACGLAPVTTAAAGPLEFVVDGDNGLVVPLRDAHALRGAVERLIDDRALLDRIRHRAHATAQNHTWRVAALQRLSFYEAALAERSGRAAPRAA